MGSVSFRPFCENDRKSIFDLMRSFYDSPALLSDVPDDVLVRNFDAVISGSPFVAGYVFVLDGQTVGYGMLAFSFSTEVGGECVWIEDIFIKEEFRHKRIGSDFLKFVEKTYPAARYRLEAERENKNAFNAYLKAGYSELDYVQLVKEKKM